MKRAIALLVVFLSGCSGLGAPSGALVQDPMVLLCDQRDILGEEFVLFEDGSYRLGDGQGCLDGQLCDDAFGVEVLDVGEAWGMMADGMEIGGSPQGATGVARYSDGWYWEAGPQMWNGVVFRGEEGKWYLNTGSMGVFELVWGVGDVWYGDRAYLIEGRVIGSSGVPLLEVIHFEEAG